LAAQRFPVEAGHVMMFARAIGDDNPVYLDPEAAAASEVGGLIAPPTFTAASVHWDPDYPLRPGPGRPWHGSASGPGRPAHDIGVLHAEQEFVYHRPVRVGDLLTPRSRAGATWVKQGRSGRLEFFEGFTDYLDADGEPVVTARSVGVRVVRGTEPETESAWPPDGAAGQL
jgi:acyl dehydratase